jgi:YVTN family beta-propeller protein
MSRTFRSAARAAALACAAAGWLALTACGGSNQVVNLTNATSDLTTTTSLGAIEARVVNADNTPYASQTVLISGVATSRTRATTNSLSRTTDADGLFQVGSLPPGTYTVQAGTVNFSLPVTANTLTTRRLDLGSPSTVRTDLGLLYIVNTLAQTLSVVDTDLLTITNNVLTTGLYPNQVVFRKGLGYVVNSGDNTIQRFNPKSNASIDTLNVGTGANPYSMIFASDTTAYVSNLYANTVAVIDLSGSSPKVSGTIPVDNAPEGLAIAGGNLYVCCSNYTVSGETVTYNTGMVDVINTSTNTVTAHLQTGAASNPQAAAVGADGALYVLCTGDYATVNSQVLRINVSTNTLSGTNLTLTAPSSGLTSAGGIAVAPNGHGFLNDTVTNRIYVIDTNADAMLLNGSASLNEGANPIGVVAAPNGTVWVFNFNTDVAHAFSSSTYAAVGSSLTTGDGPLAGAVRGRRGVRRSAVFAAGL